MSEIDLKQVSAEIEADAEKRRRQDRELAFLENDIEQAWADIAESESSPQAIGEGGDLLDQASNLAGLDPHVPIGSRRGLRGIKWLVRKLSYWYARFLTDQFNVFAGMLIRHLRHVETHLGRLDRAVDDLRDNAVPAGFGVLEHPPEPSAGVVSHVAGLADSGPCLVLSGGEGAIVEAICGRGIVTHGVEQDLDRFLTGLRRSIDLRDDSVLSHLAGFEDGRFGTIVLTGFVETLPLRDLIGMVNQASLKLKRTGRIVVAVADPAIRARVDAELGTGLGISPATWRHLLEHTGFDARLETCSDPRITEIVVAQRTAPPNKP